LSAFNACQKLVSIVMIVSGDNMLINLYPGEVGTFEALLQQVLLVTKLSSFTLVVVCGYATILALFLR